MPNDLYEVIDQRWGGYFDPAGNSQEYVTVTFRTHGSETVGNVTVSRRDYNAEFVDQVIRNWASEIERVAQL